MESLHYEIVL